VRAHVHTYTRTRTHARERIQTHEHAHAHARVRTRETRKFARAIVDTGAARVLDPVFSHLLDHTWLTRGKLWKDYRVTPW
jgi:hypothetical protein